MTIPYEAVQAAKDVMYYANPNDVERALTAAAPFLQGVKVDSMDTAPKNGDEFLARCGKEWPWFSCFWDGSAFVHYDHTDGIVHYPATEWIPIPKRMLALAPSPRAQALEPDFWSVHSKTGVHIGLWPIKDHAYEALREYEGGTITPLYRATHDHEEGFRQGIDAAAKLADYFEETIYSEGMSEDVYYGISCTVSQIAREIRALSSQPVADGCRYRILEDGETIEATDEYLEDDAVTWTPLNKDWSVGGKYHRIFKPMRRPLPASSGASE